MKLVRLTLTDTALARPTGLEPATVGLEGRCSIRLSYGRIVSRIVARALRTAHPACFASRMVGVEGFEPPTSCSQSRRATRLRYTPSLSLFSAGTKPSKRVSDGTKRGPSRQSGHVAAALHSACSTTGPTKQKGCRSTLRVANGAPGEIRTPDHQVRSLVLYPTELRAR